MNWPTNTRKSAPAWYVLRRTLPPWRLEELLAEMVEHLPRYGVDEVIVIVDTEEFFHGHPTPDIAIQQAKQLRRIKAELAKIGIAYSLNPFVTRGHEDRGRRAVDTVRGIQTVVHADGTQAACIACVLSPAWRENLHTVWGRYAETEPRVLWIDDDIRDFGAHECFCPLHLERFSSRVGGTVSREQVVEAILKPGEPHSWRTEWLAMRSEASLEVLRLLWEAVRTAAPHTRMGLMSSGPRNHCREGRDWVQVAAALGATPKRPIYSRPTLGNYWEWGPPRGLYFSQDSIKLTRHCLPPETIEQSELESVPFTRYSKSVAFTFTQLALSFAYGCHGVTINIFDHLGTPMEAEPHYGRMLGGRKKFLNALAEKAQGPGVFRGVRLLFRQNSTCAMRLALGAGFEALAGEGYPALEALEAAGIPTIYDQSDVTLLVGQQPRVLDDSEINQLLTRGLLLDGTAAAVLCERGFAGDLGLDSIRSPQPLESLGAFSVEDFSNADFGGAPKQFMSAQLPMVNYGARFAVLEPDTRSVVVSALLDPDARPVHPCMTAFQNARGGRVIVHAWDYASAIGGLGVSFHGPIRQRQLQGVVRWLFCGLPPVLATGNGAWPLAFRKDDTRETLLGFFNLSLDVWPGMAFELADGRGVAAIYHLSPEGEWRVLDSQCYVSRGELLWITIGSSLALEQPLFLWIQWTGRTEAVEDYHRHHP